MSENYRDLASEWIDATHEIETARIALQKAQARWSAGNIGLTAIENKLGKTLKTGSDARLFVVEDRYERKGLLVSRHTGYTRVQLIELEDT